MNTFKITEYKTNISCPKLQPTNPIFKNNEMSFIIHSCYYLGKLCKQSMPNSSQEDF